MHGAGIGAESLADGGAVWRAAFAAALVPPQALKPSAWAEKNFVIAEGPYAGLRFERRVAPYLIEPLDLLDPEIPVNTVTIRKSAQVGFTLLGTIWAGYVADHLPSIRMMKVLPTVDASKT